MINDKLIVFAFMCSLPLMAWAQDAVPDDQDPAKQIPSLRISVEQADNTIEVLSQVVKQKKEMADNLKKSISKSNLKALEKQKLRLEGYLTAYDQQAKTEIAKIDDQCEAETVKLLEQYREDSVLLAQLKAELGGLQGFSTKKTEEMIRQVDANWLSKSFLQLDMKELQEAVELYKERAASNNELADAYKKMQGLLDAFTIFSQGRDAVNAPYDAKTVARLIPLVKTLRNNMTDATKKKEVSRLYIQLDDYQATVQIFQDLIRELDKKKSFAQMQQEIKKQEEDDEVISSIKAIPWLNKQYALYYSELEKGNFQNAVRKCIMDLKP